MTALHSVAGWVAPSGKVAQIALGSNAAVMAHLERVLMGRATDRLTLLLVNGQTIHVRRSDGWRTHHGRSRPAGLGPDDLVHVRFHRGAPEYTEGVRAGAWGWGLALNNPGRITHWRRAA